MGFNGFLKKILPNRLYASLRQMSPAAGRADILHEISVLAAEVNKLQAGMAALRAKHSQEIQTVAKETQALAAGQAALQKTAAEAAAQAKALQETAADTIKRVKGLQGTADEAVWAQVYASATVGCGWLQGLPLNPGRFGVGYHYLYVLFRILNEVKPQKILDIGLGVTTRVISRYAEAHPCEHTIVEHSRDWAAQFARGFTLSASSY